MTENFELCPLKDGLVRCDSNCAWYVAGRYVSRCAVAVLAEELVERRIEEDEA